MADTVKIDLEENSKYRVAFDLMKVIAVKEASTNTQDREYYLRLYRQSYDTVYGYKSINEVVTGQQARSMGVRF